jgi:hypothetical protein
MAPDPFVAPYHSFLLERTPKEGPVGLASGARTNTQHEPQGPARCWSESCRPSVLPLPDQVSSRPAERSSQRRPAPLQIVHICAGYRWQRMRTITEQNGGYTRLAPTGAGHGW